MGHNYKHIRNTEKGATVVEFAVIAALLLVVLFAIMEYALIFLQSHYVANAAREGARIGVRANTYDCIDGEPILDYDGSPCINDRGEVVRAEVHEYLNLLYDEEDVKDEDISVCYSTREAVTGLAQDVYMLRVTVAAPHLFTNIVPRLLSVQFLKGNTNIKHPDKFIHTASIELEDQKEFIDTAECPE